MVHQTHCSHGRPRSGRSASNHPRSLSEAALRFGSIDSHEPRGSHDHLVKNHHRDRRPTTRFGLNGGSPGGGAPLGFTTSAKTFTSWSAPFQVASDFDSIPYALIRTLESKNDGIRRERSPFVVYHGNVLKITSNTTEARSRTQFCRMSCSVPTTHEIETLLRTKSERQICTLCSNAHGVEQEVASVPADLHRLVRHELTFSSALRSYAPACPGVGVQRLQRCGAFRGDGGSGGSRSSPRTRNISESIPRWFHMKSPRDQSRLAT